MLKNALRNGKSYINMKGYNHGGGFEIHSLPYLQTVGRSIDMLWYYHLRNSPITARVGGLLLTWSAETSQEGTDSSNNACTELNMAYFQNSINFLQVSKDLYVHQNPH